MSIRDQKRFNRIVGRTVGNAVKSWMESHGCDLLTAARSMLAQSLAADESDHRGAMILHNVLARIIRKLESGELN